MLFTRRGVHGGSRLSALRNGLGKAECGEKIGDRNRIGATVSLIEKDTGEHKV